MKKFYQVLDRIDYWINWFFNRYIPVALGFLVAQYAFLIPMILLALIFGKDHKFQPLAMIISGAWAVWVWIWVTPKIKRLHERFMKWEWKKLQR